MGRKAVRSAPSPTRHSRRRRAPRSWSAGLRHGVALTLLGAGTVGLLAAHWITAAGHHGEALGRAVTVLVVVSVLAVGSADALLLATAQSPDHYVFRTRPALRAAAVIVGATVVAATLFVVRDPFSEVGAHGTMTVDTAVDSGCLAAVFVGLIAAIVAIAASHHASTTERDWLRMRSRRTGA